MDSKIYFDDIDFSKNHLENFHEIVKKHNLTLSEYDKDVLRGYIKRKIKTRGIVDACQNLNIDDKNVKHLWVKDKNSSLFVKNPNYIEPEKNNTFLGSSYKRLAERIGKKRATRYSRY